MNTTNPSTPSQQLREMAAWVAAHADELVPHGGVYITEDGIDLDITMHLRNPREYFPTVTVSGRTEVFAAETHRLHETQRDAQSADASDIR